MSKYRYVAERERKREDGNKHGTYLNLRDINVGIVVSINDRSLRALVVFIDIDRQRLTGSICTTELHVKLLILNHKSGTFNVLSHFGCFPILISLIFHFLLNHLEVSLQKERYRSNVCARGLVRALIVGLVEDGKDNHVGIVAVQASREKSQWV